jgi:hypothetical protein
LISIIAFSSKKTSGSWEAFFENQVSFVGYYYCL